MQVDFKIKNLYDIARLKFKTKRELIEFITSLRYSLDYNFYTISVLPVVNTLRGHPEWIKDTGALLFQNPNVDRMILRAYVILLHKRFVDPEKIIESFDAYPDFCIDVKYNADNIKLLQEIVLLSPCDLEFRTKVYKNIASQNASYNDILLLPDMVGTIVKDFCYLDENLRQSMLRFISKGDIQNVVIEFLKGVETPIVLGFLKSAILTGLNSFPELNFIHTVMGDVLKNQLYMLVEELRPVRDRFLSVSQPSFYCQFWAYLTDAVESIQMEEKNLIYMAPIIPYVQEKKFLGILKGCQLKTYTSLLLLNNPAVSADEEALSRLIKRYLRVNETVKTNEPIIVIGKNVVRNLSHEQAVELANRSYEFWHEGLLVPVRFRYTSEAIAEMRTKLTTALTAGLVDASVLNNFLHAQEFLSMP